MQSSQNTSISDLLIIEKKLFILTNARVKLCQNSMSDGCGSLIKIETHKIKKTFSMVHI